MATVQRSRNASVCAQGIQITWDFTESAGAPGAVGNFGVSINNIVRILDREAGHYRPGHIECATATRHPLPDHSVDAFITDPPYYDAVPYADLSDFFYVWIRAQLPAIDPAFTDTLTPKADECIVDDAKKKDRLFFESSMQCAMSEGVRITRESAIGVVVFAHKSTEGWEAQLQAMIDAGWIITASWPIDTEWETRLRAMNSAALASSVHLVCRPRNNSVAIGDWRDVLGELPTRTREWMSRLSQEGVVGADAIFACLGPALEIFSRYSRVEKASGEQVKLNEYLTYVWGAVAQEALGQIFKDADAAGFEEDGASRRCGSGR